MYRVSTIGVVALVCGMVASTRADDAAAQKVTYQDHVLPIFRAKCGSCHNANDKKGNLVLDDYDAMRVGGGSGAVVEPGDPEASYLWSLITHASEPAMPPEQPKLPDEELAVIQKWILGGLLKDQGSTAEMPKKSTITRIEVSTDRPAGPPPMPAQYLGEPLTITSSANAVTALAVSPWAPLAAVSGFQQIALYDMRDLRLLGVLPYPEGQPHILKFSRNGALLLAGGGRGGASGKVIVFDVVTGERRIEVGDEYDLVLGADLSPDQTLIALGGPKKMLRVYSTATGELLHEMKKHTDWITAVEFSPDGVLLASGDRANGLVVWEAFTGREYLVLAGHSGAINDVSWRPDSNVLASASADTTVKLWEMNDGGQIKSWGAHGGGVSAVDYVRDGRIVTTGVDRVAKLWNGEGGGIRDFGGMPDTGLEVAFDAETERILAGDWSGTVTVWNAADGAALGVLSSNPPTLAAQVETLRNALAQTDTQTKQAQEQAAALQTQFDGLVAARKQAAADAEQKAKDAAAMIEPLTARKTAAEQTLQQSSVRLKEAEELLAAALKLYEKARQDQAVSAQAAAESQASFDGAQQELTQVQQTAAQLQEAAQQALAAAALTAEEQQALAAAKAASESSRSRLATLQQALAELEAVQQQNNTSAAAN
ncbi:MAG: c-type cytochrome domain-containing protein [Planctomycetaceae bacterium]